MNKSEAIAKSWKNPKTRGKRSNRYPVRVNGKEYKSVPAAFEALGLPKSKRIRFRGELVAASGFANPKNRALIFEREGVEYKFEIVPFPMKRVSCGTGNVLAGMLSRTIVRY